VPPGDPEAELEAGRMPFMQHIRELRDRVRNAAIAFVIAFGVCWYFSHDIYDWLKVPLREAWMMHKDTLGPTLHMQINTVTLGFWVFMSVGLWAALFVASPFIFHQLWKFIAPGLYKRERRVGVLFAIASAVCFIAGAAFCYFYCLFPLFNYMLGYADTETVFLPNISDYFDLTRTMMIAFGAVFEMPVLIFFLASIGLVTHRSLWRFNRWFIVIAFIIGAVLTPGPDVVSQLLMALPMVVLYNMSILIAYVVTRRREARAKAVEQGEADELKRDDD
jgi:sec-independent protein translocase protein TatC